MIIVALFLMLFISVTLHVYYLARYVQSRNQKYLKRFLNTTASNVLVSGMLIFFALYKPREIIKINFSLIWWLMAGSIMIMMLIIQITIFRRIYRRSQLPEHYHLNFFGKKVLHSTVANPLELGIFFATIPFLLLCGAYFVAKLIRFFI